MFTIGAFAIIFDAQNCVLLCHRRDMDAWNLPGGGMESGEMPTEAAVREVRGNRPGMAKSAEQDLKTGCPG